MGWGICFALDAQGRVYCRDGCKWRASAADYADYPPWPSAAQCVLDYFEDEAHSELDMIRDECPGTAAALAQACGEHIGTALCQYEGLSDEEKTQLHEDKLAELAGEVKELLAQLATAAGAHLAAKAALAQFKKTPPVQPKAGAKELQRELEPLQRQVELAAEREAAARSQMARATRLLNREKLFKLDA